MYQAGALLIPAVGITNDVKTIVSDSDIYGNEVQGSDKCVAGADMLSFGFAKYLKACGIVNVYRGDRSATTFSAKRNLVKSKNMSEFINKWTTRYSAGYCIYNGYLSETVESVYEFFDE